MRENILEKKLFRKSNIELLRIVLILMIIVLHYFNSEMGGLLGNVAPNSMNYYLSHFLESVSIVAVNTFILITGYFSYRKDKVHFSKAFKLVLMMIFWGIILSLITILFIDHKKIELGDLKTIIRISTSQWFVVIYCILYLQIPFLNKIINNINQHSYKVLLSIGIFFFYIWPSFYTKVTLSDGGYGIVNFVYLYFVGAYIRKYHKEDRKLGKSFVIYLISSCLVFLFSLKYGKAWDYCFIFTLIGSVAIFEIFRSLNIKYNPIINKLATYTFAVYLIDVNDFFNKFLYRTLFRSNEYWNSNSMILNLIISIVGIYFICIALDVVRQLIFGKLFKLLVGKIIWEIKA